MPYLAGTGENAKVDWSFAYVSLRAVLLPLASVVLLSWLAWRFVRASSGRERAAIVPTLFVPLGIIALCLAYQWPLFAG